MSRRTAASPEPGVTALLVNALLDPHAGLDLPGHLTAAALIETAVHHRVLLLLGWLLRAAGTLTSAPWEFTAAFTTAERRAVVIDHVRQAELNRLLDATGTAGLRVLPFKGAALAHTHYPVPYVRVRSDTDLLIAPADVAAVADVLNDLEYVRAVETSGRIVSYQSHYAKTDRHGVCHALDVHWRISNAQALADRFTFEELWARRVALPGLGPFAMTVDSVHALLLAAIHLVGHHPGDSDLLWRYDRHLIASRLTADQLREARDLASARGLTGLVEEKFSDTQVGEPLRRVDVLRRDLVALRGWRQRCRLLAEHLLPPASYIQARYGVSRAFVPICYVWRLIVGVPRWFRAS